MYEATIGGQKFKYKTIKPAEAPADAPAEVIEY
jgi:hypothetical protein